MNTWILAAYIATTAFALYGLFFDYSTSSQFKPITDGTVKTREGNKFFRNKDGTFNKKKYLLVWGIPLVAIHVVGWFTGQLLFPTIFNFFVGIPTMVQGMDNKKKMKQQSGAVIRGE